jgi:Fic family protein
VRGYRRALDLIHTRGQSLEISEKTIKHLHELSRGDIWDAGKYRVTDAHIIERYADGRERIRFRPTPANLTPTAMRDLVRAWNDCTKEKWAAGPVALAAFNLDFLCIHPFRDGNGREWIRNILAGMRREEKLTCHGRGPAARWRGKGSTSK